MFRIGFPELILIVVILLLLFGSLKLPKLARGVSEPASELQKGFDKSKPKQTAKHADKPEGS